MYSYRQINLNKDKENKDNLEVELPEKKNGDPIIPGEGNRNFDDPVTPNNDNPNSPPQKNDN